MKYHCISAKLASVVPPRIPNPIDFLVPPRIPNPADFRNMAAQTPNLQIPPKIMNPAYVPQGSLPTNSFDRTAMGRGLRPVTPAPHSAVKQVANQLPPVRPGSATMALDDIFRILGRRGR